MKVYRCSNCQLRIQAEESPKGCIYCGRSEIVYEETSIQEFMNIITEMAKKENNN